MTATEHHTGDCGVKVTLRGGLPRRKPHHTPLRGSDHYQQTVYGGDDAREVFMLWSEQTLDNIYKLIGERIRTRRTDRGITQTDLSQAVQLTRSSIANIEAGRQRAMIHTIMQIANYLEIDPSELFPAPAKKSRSQLLGEQLEGQPDSTLAFVRNIVERAGPSTA